MTKNVNLEPLGSIYFILFSNNIFGSALDPFNFNNLNFILFFTTKNTAVAQNFANAKF